MKQRWEFPLLKPGDVAAGPVDSLVGQRPDVRLPDGSTIVGEVVAARLVDGQIMVTMEADLPLGLAPVTGLAL